MLDRLRRTGRALAPAPFLVLLAGCVLPDQLSKIQKDVADVRAQVLSLEREQRDARAKLAALESKLAEGGDVKRFEFADLKVQVEQAQRQISALDERATDAQRRMDRLSQDVAQARDLGRRLASSPPPTAAPGTDPGATPATPWPPEERAGSAIPSADALYNAAYADFSKGNYALAVSGFEEYASRFPDTPLADNALYWIGECHMSQGRFSKAVEAFDRMLEKYPSSDKAPAANLKKGLAYLEDNNVRLAMVQLRYVATTYPSSDEAKIARDKLASLGADR